MKYIALCASMGLSSSVVLNSIQVITVENDPVHAVIAPCPKEYVPGCWVDRAGVCAAGRCLCSPHPYEFVSLLIVPSTLKPLPVHPSYHYIRNYGFSLWNHWLPGIVVPGCPGTVPVVGPDTYIRSGVAWVRTIWSQGGS